MTKSGSHRLQGPNLVPPFSFPVAGSAGRSRRTRPWLSVGAWDASRPADWGAFESRLDGSGPRRSADFFSDVRISFSSVSIFLQRVSLGSCAQLFLPVSAWPVVFRIRRGSRELRKPTMDRWEGTGPGGVFGINIPRTASSFGSNVASPNPFASCRFLFHEGFGIFGLLEVFGTHLITAPERRHPFGCPLSCWLQTRGDVEFVLLARSPNSKQRERERERQIDSFPNSLVFRHELKGTTHSSSLRFVSGTLQIGEHRFAHCVVGNGARSMLPQSEADSQKCPIESTSEAQCPGFGGNAGLAGNDADTFIESHMSDQSCEPYRHTYIYIYGYSIVESCLGGWGGDVCVRFPRQTGCCPRSALRLSFLGGRGGWVGWGCLRSFPKQMVSTSAHERPLGTVLMPAKW